MILEEIDKEFENCKTAEEKHEKMRRLFKENRFLFERWAQWKTQQVIKNAPPEIQPSLHDLQKRWDQTVKNASDPHNRLVLARHMLMDHVLNKFLPVINSFLPRERK